MSQHEIDFLPAHFRQQHARRRELSRYAGLAAVVIGLLAALAGWQSYSAGRARRNLDDLMPQYDQAVRQNAELSKLQAELQVAQAEAELITYLAHPWPRSRLLAALVAPLPDAITLQEISITRHNNRPEGAALMPQLDRQTQDQRLARLPPAARDLKTLRDQYDRSRVMISLTGMTADDAAPHRYVAELSKSDLFSQADLVSLGSGAGPRDGRLEFKAVVVVRPGYGLPDGPSSPPHDALAQKEPQP